MRKPIVLLFLAIFAMYLPDARAQWGYQSSQVDVNINGCRFVGLKSQWNSNVEYFGTLTLPDGSRIITKPMSTEGAVPFNANFQPAGGVYYKISPSGQVYSMLYLNGVKQQEAPLPPNMKYRFEKNCIVLWDTSSSGSNGSYGAAPNNYNQSAPSSRPSSSSSVYKSRVAVCSGCQGTGKCRLCNGSGRNSRGNQCSRCHGAGRCQACAGVGKKYY